MYSGVQKEFFCRFLGGLNSLSAVYFTLVLMKPSDRWSRHMRRKFRWRRIWALMFLVICLHTASTICCAVAHSLNIRFSSMQICRN